MAEAGDLVAERYLLKKRIAAGGMGVVWLAHDRKLDRPVAIKCAQMGHDPMKRQRMVKRLMSEARIAARLRHPHIVSVFDRIDEGDEGGDCWLVMEYVPSRSLAQIMAADGPMAPERVAAIGRQIAGALAAAHAEGVVHGDVSPQNILITEDERAGGVEGALNGIAKLTDFGIARVLWSDASDSLSGGLRGKPPYVAPEVARVEPLSRESDLFSLGATLFAAVEGHSPYGQVDDAVAYLGRAIEGHVETPRRAGPLTGLLTELLRKDPKDRPTAVRARERLAEIAPDLGGVGGVGGAGGAFTPVGRLWRAVRLTRRRALLGSGVVALAAAVVAGLLLYEPGSGRGTTDGHTTSGHDDKPGTPVWTLGDARTADPCSLLDTASLDGFGRTELTADYGNFDRCDVLVEAGDESAADIAVTFIGADLEAGSQVRTERHGRGTVAREPQSGDECERILGLADSQYVQVRARRTEASSPDLCAMADAATDHALKVLDRGRVPRRPGPPPPGSLEAAHACALLDAAALARVPGMNTTGGGGAARPEAGFGDWECRWDSTAGDAGVQVLFDRNSPLDAEDGQPAVLGGRQSFVAPEYQDEGTCTARIVNRTYKDLAGDAGQELVELTVSGSGPVGQLCDAARELGAVAAAGLPKP